MTERPSIQKPSPIAASEIKQSSDPIFGGINIPKFSADMQAEVSPEAAPLWNFVTKHIRYIAGAIVSLVVIITVIAGWQWYREKQLAETKLNLGRIIAMPDPENRFTELKRFLETVPAQLESSVLLELASTAVSLEKWDDALEFFKRISLKTSSAPLGFSARMNHAQLQMRKSDFLAARKEFHELAQSAPQEIKSLLYQLAAEAAEMSKDKAGAITDYEAAVAALPPTDSQSNAFFLARIAQLKK